MSFIFPSGATDKRVTFFVGDDSGLPVTGLVAATLPTLTLSTPGVADVTDTLSDLASLTATHADWGVYERGQGYYDLCIPDLDDGEWQLRGEATDKRVICAKIQVGYVQSDVRQFGGTNGTFSGGRPEVNASHWGGTAVASANVLIDGAITAAKIAADAITDAKVASDVTIASVTNPVTVGTNNDKTGYKLASDGLDSISTTAPSGVAANFREMMVQVWRRFFKRATLTSSELVTYADDNTTPVTTQTVSDNGTTQVQGPAS